MDSQYEQARRCYECTEPGVAAGIKPAPERRMGKLHIFRCDNKRCKKFENTWVVQVRPDGTVPDPVMNREKNYPVEGDARARIARARASVDATIQQSLEH